MPRTTATSHDPHAATIADDHADQGAALAHADEWIARHRNHGCTVHWLTRGRIVADHPTLRIAAVLTIELDKEPTP